jgi:hypothetical protein
MSVLGGVPSKRSSTSVQTAELPPVVTPEEVRP